MLYNLLLLLPINKWVNKKKREIKKEKKNINSGDDHQWWEIAIPFYIYTVTFKKYQLKYGQ
jgi:hypothetical protein